MRLKIHLKDPSEKDETGGMKAKALVFVRLNRPYDKLRKNSERPTSRVIDDAIIAITDDWQVASTWNKEPPPAMSCCARCGAGLFTMGCKQCGIQSKFNGSISFDQNPPPLPQKVIDFLLSKGHVFLTNPREAQSREMARR